jgi:acyl-CoA reductase-like NAD-dependent aldehyde dehydrogenase
LADCDAAVERLAARKEDWVKVGLPERIAYLRKCLQGVTDVAPAWVEDGCKMKGLEPGDDYAGEEWLAGPVTTIRNIRLLIDSLEQSGQPKLPGVSTHSSGQKIVRVFPGNLQDRLMFTGFVADVWLEPGKEATQGRIYREGGAEGGVNLILGAGNVSSIPPMDVLYKLFVENEVVILKMNPVNEHVGPKIERAFQSLISDGYLAVVYGGVEVGQHLTTHAGVDSLHVTGSDRTHDAIVWGTDSDEVARRKAADEPINTRPFSAELGCVTPVLIVPGQWSDADIAYQARHVAGMVAQNASFNCNAAKCVVLAKGWPQRAQFLDKLREVLRETRPRKAYYPGAQSRYEGFVAQYDQAEVLGLQEDGVVPWTLIPGITPIKGEYALSNEAFCGVIAEVSLDVTTPSEFLKEAVRFCNDDLWGTLSCMVLIDSKTQKADSDAFEQAIADLRYGGIAVNCWAGLIYGLVLTTWGAFPGHTPQDIQSGTGVVHNSLMLDHPQKSVVRAPFRINPTPVWFADHKNLTAMAQRLASYEARPSWGGVLKVALAALKG